MEKYLPRIADLTLQNKLKSSGAVLIKGPKWCGKSTTALQVARSKVFMQNPQMKDHLILLAKNDSRLFLTGETPMLIDEWQIIPFIWDAIRFEIDQRDAFSQFILTGSATPPDDGSIEHSGVGRITTMTMRPMSLFESRESTGEVSLKRLFEGYFTVAKSTKSLADYAFYICRGGWPKAIDAEPSVALQIANNYYDGLIEEDLYKTDHIKRDHEKLRAVLRSYARHTATEASISTMVEDVKASSGSISDTSIENYLAALRRLFVIEELKAWNPNLRSKTAVRSTPTRHFVDPSIGASALGIGPQNLLDDLRTFGLFFESLVVRDLRVYSEALNGSIYHYRDQKGREVDVVIQLRNGEWVPVEVKLADFDSIEEGARKLLELVADIDVEKMKKPAFMLIITTTGIAYQRSDGIYVVPLSCLTY